MSARPRRGARTALGLLAALPWLASALLLAACSDGGDGAPTRFAYDVPLAADSPWPKFRRDAAQTGQSPIAPTERGGHLWTFPTGKGIFSSPVIGGDGTIYIGSADRTFYALDAAGSVRWQLLTGEIVDSAALLDDRGQLYFGSGDGRLYALDAADGRPRWTFTADDPSVNAAFISWFEGNVAIGSDGTLFAPNDNFFTYALDRDSGDVRWRFETSDQTWSSPAVDAAGGRLFMGNNFQIAPVPNIVAIDAASGAQIWGASSQNGSVAASPMIDPEGRMFVGGFDGFLRAFDQATGELLWAFGARDHIYASPARQPDGTVVQPSADGSVYGLDPASGVLRWQLDTREPIRSSPAIDAQGNVYVGSGDGRLLAIGADGRLRWSIRLIDEPRNDLNSSPALGRDAIVIGGESGGVFSVPHDYCLRDEARDDERCSVGPDRAPPEGASLLFTTQFGGVLTQAPAEIDENQPLTFSLVAREDERSRLALIDSQSLVVELDPPSGVRVDVSGDRRFVTIAPDPRLRGGSDGTLAVRIRAATLIEPEREGLRFSGGREGPPIDAAFRFRVRTPQGPARLPLPVPAQPGDPAGIWELYRIAAPLPTILPSYNQIGFDSIHYLVGLVEPFGDDGAIAWVVGAKLAEGENRTVVDPTTKVLFPFEVHHDRGLLTLINQAGFAVEFNGIRLPFNLFRVATRIDASGQALESPRLNVFAVCGGINFYGTFLRLLGLCNPDTDVLDVYGGAELRPFAGGVGQPPSGVGPVTFSVADDRATATLADSSLLVAEHALGLLLIDASSGTPVPLDYGYTMERTADGAGRVRSVSLPLAGTALPAATRLYLMVDAYPAAKAELVTDTAALSRGLPRAIDPIALAHPE